MKHALIIALLLTLGSLASATNLKIIDTPEDEPRLSQLAEVQSLGLIETPDELIAVKLWREHLVIESNDRNGELFLSLEHQTEGLYTEVYRLPIEDVSSVTGARWVPGNPSGDRFALKHLQISYEVFNYDTGSTKPQEVTIEFSYDQYGNFDVPRMAR